MTGDPRDPRPRWWENYAQYIERVLGIAQPSRPPGTYAEPPIYLGLHEPSWVVNSVDYHIQCVGAEPQSKLPPLCCLKLGEPDVGHEWKG